MQSERKGVSPLVSVALLLVVVLAASSVLASNINVSPYLPPEDVDKNRLLESISIVDVLESSDGTLGGAISVSVYILNKGSITANISAIYIGDAAGNLVYVNTSIDRAVSPGDVVEIDFTRSNDVNWTTFLAVTARGNFDTFLLGSGNKKTPDYIYAPGYIIINDNTKEIVFPNAETIYDIIGSISSIFDTDTMTPNDLKAFIESKNVTSEILKAEGNKIEMSLNQASEGNATFMLFNNGSDSINVTLTRRTEADKKFDYVCVYFLNQSTSNAKFDLKRNITDSEWPKDADINIFIQNASDYLKDGLFSMRLVLVNHEHGKEQFKFDLSLSSGTSVYEFNPVYVVSFSDPYPSVPYVKGILFEITGSSNLPGNYSVLLYNYRTQNYDLNLTVLPMSTTEESFNILYMGDVFDYISSDYTLQFMIKRNFDAYQLLSLNFSSMHVQLFIQSDQESS